MSNVLPIGLEVQSDHTLHDQPNHTLPLPLLYRIILHQSPSLYTLTMSTGILSILLRTLVYPSTWSKTLSTILFLLNLSIFLLLTLCQILRYTLFKGVWKSMWKHDTAFLFWGCILMGFCTILTMLGYTIFEWGVKWRGMVVGLWWVNAVFGVGISVITYFYMCVQSLFSR